VRLELRATPGVTGLEALADLLGSFRAGFFALAAAGLTAPAKPFFMVRQVPIEEENTQDVVLMNRSATQRVTGNSAVHRSALVTDTAVSRWLVNAYVSLARVPYPTPAFSDLDDPAGWVTRY